MAACWAGAVAPDQEVRLQGMLDIQDFMNERHLRDRLENVTVQEA